MTNKDTDLKAILQAADNMRRNLIKMGFDAGPKGLHFGGCLSCVEILSVLYKAILNVNPIQPQDPARDRFILSKGHCSATHYAALHEAGFLSEEELFSFESDGGHFPTHSVIYPEKAIEISSGSLGNGLSVGVGSALAANRKKMGHRVFVLMGNGECNEGAVWEAVMAAAQMKLDNLIAIVDHNGFQLDGESKHIMNTGNLSGVFTEFGWNVVEVDGHSVTDLYDVLHRIQEQGAPTVIVAHTTKGKGISFMENNPLWHHSRISQQDYDRAILELEGGADGV